MFSIDIQISYSIIIINILLAFILIYFEHNEPNVTWAWLLVLVMFPILGFVLYLVVGLDGKRQYVYVKKQVKDRQILNEIFDLNYEGLKFLHNHKEKALLKEYLKMYQAKKFQRFIFLNYKTSNAIISMNNKVDLFFEGEDLFADIINEINNASTYIHLQSYIIRNDFVTEEIKEALLNARKRGVEVKVLTDKIGSFFLSKDKVQKLNKHNISVSFFPTFTKFSMNLRNHRKVLIIDGKIGYIGGFNIGKEYVGKDKKFGHWRDSHAKIIGDSAKLLEIAFIYDWNSSPKESKILLDEKYFPALTFDETYDCRIQIVRSGPDTETRNIELAFVKLINTAQRSIYIVTPYFMPGPSLTVALKTAIYSGVNVTIMFPKNPDHAFVFGASMSHIRELLEIGAKCYAYDEGFVHSKILVVDETVTSIGSANFDSRSFKLNFEITSFIYNIDCAKRVIEQIKKDIEKSDRLTPLKYHKRKVSEKIKEAFSRLLSPLL